MSKTAWESWKERHLRYIRDNQVYILLGGIIGTLIRHFFIVKLTMGEAVWSVVKLLIFWNLGTLIGICISTGIKRYRSRRDACR